MKGLSSHLFWSFLVLSLCVMLTLSLGIIMPGDVQAFGSLSENGTAAFMGIGVTPTKILHVSGTGPGTVPLFQRASDSAGFIIERTPTNRWVLGVNESPTLGNGFVLSTIPTGNTSVPRLMITPTGRVGINTTDPSSQAMLHVKGGETGSFSAVYGEQVSGSGSAGVTGRFGAYPTGTRGHLGMGSYGVYGIDETSGNYGTLGKTDKGVYGFCISGTSGGCAVEGKHQDGPYGTLGTSEKGVYGAYNDSGGPYGHIGGVDYGIYGNASGPSKYAGYFQGQVKIMGSFATWCNVVVDYDHSLTSEDSFIAVNATSANITITLPNAFDCGGRVYTIKKVAGWGNVIVSTTGGSNNIDGMENYVLDDQYKYVTVVSGGPSYSWLIAANGP